MSLTSEDLKNIQSIVKAEVADFPTRSEINEKFAALDEKFATKDDLDRMEGRITTAINLLQRDSYSRLDDHDTRIARLERAVSP